MTQTTPTPHQSMSFYRAALSAARFLDRDNDARVLDPDADAAWKAYGSDLPSVLRCDLVLRNFAMLYPAAFAPGPVFRLSGWYDDDPWGTGFERPPAKEVEAIFAKRPPASTNAAEALELALVAWSLAGARDADAHADAVVDHQLASRLSPSTKLLVVGARAVAEVARAVVRGERLVARTQVIVVGDQPESRHVLAIACALLREAGLPLFAEPPLTADEPLTTWAAREAPRLGGVRAQLLVTSSDAAPRDLEAARALASALGVDETIAIAAPIAEPAAR